MKQNPYFKKVAGRYLFQEVRARLASFRHEHPDVDVISLSIGDTSEPIAPYVAKSLKEESERLGTPDGYSGYGPDAGIKELRHAISQKIYNNHVSPDDIFISDGAKCDIGRLQLLFGPDATIALQDPAYPVYLDTSLLFRGKNVKLLPCTPENGFIPNLQDAKGVDILFLCMPNNPTGAAFTYEELSSIVAFAKEHQITIVFDTAYSFYVQEGYPKSIYEIPGADEVAIELSSFSKIAGFSGVRLAWSVVPSKLTYSNNEPVQPDWSRITSTFFNGASIISQKGGLAVLSDQGMKEVRQQVQFYLENTRLLKKAASTSGFEVFGGEHSPYLWVRVKELSSWEAFDLFLKKLHIVTTPGIGFGPSGDQFLRISGFGKRIHIEEAARRLEQFNL
jgi:LL-diaminopimelate aminotransferase